MVVVDQADRRLVLSSVKRPERRDFHSGGIESYRFLGALAFDEFLDRSSRIKLPVFRA